ncbi:MAG: 3-deoxy-8-phosphooctulonate synthase [Nitrospiraceae bacterium]|nr:3-deoxy-8-phosphooctulonate synthase [Nitrospiraceae bacterium]
MHIATESIGGGGPLVIIAGPCVIENEETVFHTAQKLKETCASLSLPFVFKSSYDKANRSSIKSFRGPGLERGLRILSDVKSRFGVPVLSDVHSVQDVEAAKDVLDIIQIPAFLCRQTDIILAVSNTGKPGNIKKGQFLSPWEMKNIIGKFTSTGNGKLILTERGSTFGYNNLVVDMRALPIMRGMGHPVVFDVTHSVQLPGGKGESSGGQREFAGTLARAAAAAGVDGLFIETHPEPDKALCDGPNMLPLDLLPQFLETLKRISEIK